MKVKYDGKKYDFESLMRILKVKDQLLFAVEPLSENVNVEPEITAAVMFNILGFYVQLLEDKEQNIFVKAVKEELINMIDNGFDHFDRGEKIK